jgi:hypothetical protein
MSSASDTPLASQQEQLRKFAARGRFKKAINTVCPIENLRRAVYSF